MRVAAHLAEAVGVAAVGVDHVVRQAALAAALAMPPVSSSLTAWSMTTALCGTADRAESVLLYAWVSMPLVSTSMMWLFGNARVDRLDAGDRALVAGEHGGARLRLGAADEVGDLARVLLLGQVGHVRSDAFFSVLKGSRPTCGELGKRGAHDRRTAGILAGYEDLGHGGLVLGEHLEVDEAVDALVDQRLQVADGDRAVQVVDRLQDRGAAHACAAAYLSPSAQADRERLAVGEDVIADLVARLLAQGLGRVRSGPGLRTRTRTH